jgi:hypothetical protein
MVPPGHLIAPGWLKKNKGEDHAILPPCQFIPKGIEDKIENDNEDHHGQNDKAAPVITAITASVSTSSAVITWTTNEPANSSVSFGTTAAYGTSANDFALVNNHSVTLAGLTPLTSYNYQVKSIDLAGNMATSSNLTFTTGSIADVIPPVIGNISTSAASTTATVSWTTNEGAASKLYFATTTPVSLATASLMSDSTLLTTHSMPLTGLMASTTYHFLLTAMDLANNSATSTEQIFMTTN